MRIKYTGTSDFQEFGKGDFDKAGVEGGKKVRFAQNEPTEVDDALGEALVSKEGLFGDFSFEEVSEDEPMELDNEDDELGEGDPDGEPEPKASGKGAKGGKTRSSGTSSTGSTGKGTSTGGANATGNGSSTAGSPS